MEKNIQINYKDNYEAEEFANKVKYYSDMLKKKAVLEAEVKAMSKFLLRLDQHLTEEMMENSIGSHEVDGVKFTVASEDTFSLDRNQTGTDKWDNELFFKWLAEIGEEALIKVRESIHPATRVAFLREQINNGVALPGWIIQKVFTHLKFNKSEIERQAGVRE